MAFHVPTVTVEDLRAFHSKHFPHASAPEHFVYAAEAAAAEEPPEEEEDGDDDGLGYYSDGMKRTLTDAQIAIFRHSEIRAILRERKLKMEDGEVMEEQVVEEQESPADALLQTGQEVSARCHHLASAKTAAVGLSDAIGCQLPDTPQSIQVKNSDVQRWTTSSARTKAKNKKHRNNYRAKLKAAKLQREQEQKNGSNGDRGDESDEWDPWHQANGPDVQKQDAVDLDY